MTQNEFQHRYHDWISQSEAEASSTAHFVNVIGVDNETIVPVHIPFVGWCLMLKTAAEYIRDPCGINDLVIEK